MKDLTGREVEPSWSPYNPICNDCGKINTTKVISFNEEKKYVEYECTCGKKGESLFKAGGKLTWRVDWPARWKVLKVTVEPFGKDHSSRGGSYDTGKRIVREIFDGKEPFPIVYEWIGLKGKGDMSSSKGNVVSIKEMLTIIPPEVVKYYILKAKPSKHITFDPVTSLVNLIDEYDEPSNVTNVDAYKLSQVHGLKKVGVPFKHLVILLQITDGNIEDIKKRLIKSGYQIPDDETLKERLEYASNWLKSFAPIEAKFEIKKELPIEANTLSDLQKQALTKIEKDLQETSTPEEIQQLIYNVSKELEIPTKELFTALYILFLGKTEGPRIGLLLQSLKFEFVKKRLKEI
jgi:lysyl-tRNA synthetase class 1